MARTAGGGTLAAAAEPRAPGGAPHGRPALRVGLAAASAAALGLGLVAGVRAGAGALRERELLRAVGAGRAVAAALETYDVEHGAFPPAVGRAALLAGELRDSLGRPAVLARAAGPFSYDPRPGGYTLAFTPAPGGLPVGLVVTAGRGGVLTAGGTSVALGW